MVQTAYDVDAIFFVPTLNRRLNKNARHGFSPGRAFSGCAAETRQGKGSAVEKLC
jgi:hypothetical protein